jgi:hypothetical protein
VLNYGAHIKARGAFCFFTWFSRLFIRRLGVGGLLLLSLA